MLLVGLYGCKKNDVTGIESPDPAVEELRWIYSYYYPDFSYVNWEEVQAFKMESGMIQVREDGVILEKLWITPEQGVYVYEDDSRTNLGERPVYHGFVPKDSICEVPEHFMGAYVGVIDRLEPTFDTTFIDTALLYSIPSEYGCLVELSIAGEYAYTGLMRFNEGNFGNFGIINDSLFYDKDLYQTENLGESGYYMKFKGEKIE